MTQEEQAQLRQYLEKLERVGLVVQGETGSGLLAVGSIASSPVSIPVGQGVEPIRGVQSWPPRIDGEAYMGFFNDFARARQALEPRQCPSKGPEFFEADVHLLDTLTDERAIFRSQYEQLDESGEYLEYIWAEGNFSCDCNRGTFFEQSSEPTDDDGTAPLEHPCGDGRYRVEKLVRLSDGKVLYYEVN